MKTIESLSQNTTFQTINACRSPDGVLFRHGLLERILTLEVRLQKMACLFTRYSGCWLKAVAKVSHWSLMGRLVVEARLMIPWNWSSHHTSLKARESVHRLLRSRTIWRLTCKTFAGSMRFQGMRRDMRFISICRNAFGCGKNQGQHSTETARWKAIVDMVRNSIHWYYNHI